MKDGSDKDAYIQEGINIINITYILHTCFIFMVLGALYLEGNVRSHIPDRPDTQPATTGWWPNPTHDTKHLLNRQPPMHPKHNQTHTHTHTHTPTL